MEGEDDTEISRRKYRAPYTPQKPVPSVRRYRAERARRGDPDRNEKGGDGGEEGNPLGEYMTINEDDDEDEDDEERGGGGGTEHDGAEQKGVEQVQDGGQQNGGDMIDTSEYHITQSDPKNVRKLMKKRHKKFDGTRRKVTDPVTHLPVVIRDFTGGDLKNVPENIGLEDEDLEEDDLGGRFPPPQFETVKGEMVRVIGRAVVIALVAAMGVGSGAAWLVWKGFQEYELRKNGLMVSSFGAGIILVSIAVFFLWAVWGYTAKKIDRIWDNEVWEAERRESKEIAKAQSPETVQWLNSLLASIWPLVNPDLFTSLADTLEDVMQASLPKVVRMISIDDIGQGSEALRILGVKWLPHGAAARSVSQDGRISDDKNSNKQNDRSVPGQGEVDNQSEDKNNKNGGDDDNTGNSQADKSAIAEGMEAEEGDFVNVEIAFSYRARGKRKRGMGSRTQNAHMYLAFYLPGNIMLPVWVELQGVVGMLRMRLQLTPDPPFFSLCTTTLLGQPKVDLSCFPLVKKGLNIMDLPLISSFVQSSVDAAIAEYVAPKSLTLDLKDMLVGDDFKIDTVARGILVVQIKRGYDFKEGDSGFGPLKQGSSDAYVTVGWAKFGKPLWSTRVIHDEMKPYWDETGYLLVTPDELNVDERLRVQLWDSDRTSADDDLGRIEVDLKGLMKDSESTGKMSDRTDGFMSLKKGEGMPGKLEWRVGYFSKTRILEEQLAKQTKDPEIKTMGQLKEKVAEESERKLREAKHDERTEISQQKAQDLKKRQDELISQTPPSEDYPTGILSIQIHQIVGLEKEKLNKEKEEKHDKASEHREEGTDLPSSYCTIMLNHQKIFKTRTKPKNSKPFFNASCERVIRDWRSAEIHISVRDARVHEDDALLGVIYLPLRKIFAERCQVDSNYPIAGGMGHGKARVSLVFRSIQLQAPRNLIGWDWGTLEIDPEIKSLEMKDESLKGAKLKIHTSLAKGKYKSKDEPGVWKPKKGKSLKLAVKKRYSSPLVIELVQKSTLRDTTAAFCVLWLKDIPDDEEQTLKLPVWKGDLEKASNSCLPSAGERVGTLEVGLTFWAGLSGYHMKSSEADRDLADVMEILDTVDEDEDLMFADSSDDSSDNDDDDDTETETSSVSDAKQDADTTQNGKRKDSSVTLSTEGKRGFLDEAKDYKKHAKQLHRRNRGLMQWKGPRTAKWMAGKVGDGQRKVKDLFKHHDNDGTIETES